MTGRTFGPYTILEKLGAGAMGEIYKARHERLDRFVAVKVLTADHVADPEHRRRFLREAQAASALNHPNIVGIHDSFTVDGCDVLVMEFVAGRTLDQMIPPRGMDANLALKYAIPIADALAAAHAARIVHRDLKPTNVIVSDEGVVKLLDFGVARRIAPYNLDTMEGAIVGTVSYMSPEQAEGHPVDARSDIFAFGAVLYEMLSGSRAFDSDSTVATLMAVIREEPKALRTLVKDLPAEIDAIVTRCLSKDPALRYQKSTDVKTALEHVLQRPGAHGGAQPEPAKSIAVLPFANLSADKENEYFSDGLAEEILNGLSKLPGSRVASRTSAFAFRGKEQNIAEIGRALNVDHVLEGTVRRAGNRVRVTARITAAAEGFQVWSERYDREITDIFAIQDEISQAIVDVLKIKLGGHPVAPRAVPGVEAYTLYLKGRYLLRRFTSESNAKAKAHFERALDLDPSFTLSRAGIAICDVASAVFGWAAPKRVIESCRLTFEKALQFDDTLVDVHWAFGTLLALFENDWAGAEREYKRALELDPDSPQAHWTYGHYFLQARGRLDEALVHVKRAVELEPLMLHFGAALADLHKHRREYDLAIEQFQSLIEMEPTSYIAHWLLGSTYCLIGMFQESIAAVERAVALAGPLPLVLGTLGAAHAVAGRERHARQVIAELERRSVDAYVPPGAFAWIYTALNEPDNAFDWLEKAIEASDPSVVWLATDPAFDTLRPDPRYKTLLRKLKLE